MFWTVVTIAFLGFVALSLKGPVERTLANRSERKLAKINRSKTIKQLEGRVKELEMELVKAKAKA